jgi:N6-adenosine-specific RNA methylase IME4
MDPPWNERGGGQIKRGADRHYPLLKTEEMPAVIRGCEHWPRLCDDGHLYMWVTNNFLEDGLWLIRRLGYRYITNVVWAKEQMGIGQYFRGQHELLLFGVRGDTYIPTEGTWSTLLGGGLLDHPRENGKRIHSKKPPEAHELIEQASPGRHLELFARDERKGWICWGNEVSDE